MVELQWRQKSKSGRHASPLNSNMIAAPSILLLASKPLWRPESRQKNNNSYIHYVEKPRQSPVDAIAEIPVIDGDGCTAYNEKAHVEDCQVAMKRSSEDETRYVQKKG